MAHIQRVEIMSNDRLGVDGGEKVPFRVYHICSKCEGTIPRHSQYCLWCGVKLNDRN